MPATLEPNGEEDPTSYPMQDIFSGLDRVLDAVKDRGIADKSEIEDVKDIFRDPELVALAKVHDKVAQSQSLDQPVDEVGGLIQQFSETEGRSQYELTLISLLRKPHIRSLFETHDMVKYRQYEPHMPVVDNMFVPSYTATTEGSAQRTVGLHKSPEQPLGITLKMVDGKVVIARILHGGLIHKQGLLQVGDRIVKVNHEEVGSMTPLELQDMLKGSSGSLVITVEPSAVEPHFFGTQVYVKAHFRYIPENDRLLPAKEAGLPFIKGDILEVLSQEDTFWWQASKYGSHSAAGLIPSQQLEERRKTFNLSENSNVGCMGRRKPKRQLIYSSHHNGTFEPYDVILYEKVNLIPDFKRKTLLLIGSQYIGRRELKQRLVEDQPDRYGEVRAHTTKGREPVDVMEGAEGYFHVSEEAMKTDMQAHKFIEYGRHQQYLYGIKSDNVLEVIESGRMVVLEVYPQTIKMVRTSVYSPLIVFIKPTSLEGMRQLYQNVAMQQQTQPSPQKKLTDVEFKKCLEESEQIEKLYSNYFDATIINEDIDIAYEELLTVIKKFTTGPQWVPTGWVM